MSDTNPRDAAENYAWYVAFRAVRRGPIETWPNYDETSRIARECVAHFRHLLPEAGSESQAQRGLVVTPEAIRAAFETYVADVRYDPADHPRMMWLFERAIKAAMPLLRREGT